MKLNMATGAGGGKQRPPEDEVASYVPKKKAPSKKK